MNIQELRSEVRKRWNSGAFIETQVPVPPADYGLPWVSYETYMRAQLVKAVPGEIGLLLVDFPPESAEDNALHIHPVSDRKITVISGSGEFQAVISRKREVFRILPGHRVWMPRGVVHTFVAGKQGLLVESIHNPFVSFNDPRCLVYPKNYKPG
jgi:quercetin dioxygenase-like cupin family protein